MQLVSVLFAGAFGENFCHTEVGGVGRGGVVLEWVGLGWRVVSCHCGCVALCQLAWHE